MSHLTAVTGTKRPLSGNPTLPPNKKQKTELVDSNSNTPSQINGHSYTILPSQETFNQNTASSDPRLLIRSRVAPTTSSSNGSREEDYYALKERITQLESRVSALEAILSRSLNSVPLSTEPAPVSSSQPQIVPPPTQPVMPRAIDPSLLQGQKDYEKGNEFFAQKEYEKAIEHYLKVLPVAPNGNEFHLYFILGRCYRNTKEFPKALDYFSKITPPTKQYIAAQIKIAGCYHDQNEYKQAIEILSKIQVQESDQDYDEFHAVSGDCHRQLDDQSKAIEHYNKVSQSFVFFAHVQNFLGLCYVAKEDPQTAIGFFREAIIFAGSNKNALGHAHFNLGAIYFSHNDHSKAIMHFNLVPKDHQIFDEAQERLKRCQTPKPLNTVPQSLPPPAQPDMSASNDPSLLLSLKTHFEKGNEFFAQKEYKKAIELYLKTLEFEPRNSFALFNLGRCYRNTKEFPKAIDCFSKVLQPNNMYIPAQIEIARCHFNQKEYKQAIEILTKIQLQESDNHYEAIHVEFGDCHRLLKEPSIAIEHYKKVTQNSTLFGPVQRSLGLCYCVKNELQTAIGFFREAIIFAGSNEYELGNAHFHLGHIYLEQKDESKAIMHFKLVPKGHQRFGKAQEHLKECQTPKPVQ